METLKFKTNIKCGGCIAQVTPHLNNVEGIRQWQVDTASPDKVLTVEFEDVEPRRIVEAVQTAGFKAQAL
jgi:copper chaperone